MKNIELGKKIWDAIDSSWDFETWYEKCFGECIEEAANSILNGSCTIENGSFVEVSHTISKDGNTHNFDVDPENFIEYYGEEGFFNTFGISFNALKEINAIKTLDKDYVKGSLDAITSAIKNKSFLQINNPELNEVIFDYGDFGDLTKNKNGSNGNGIIHIIQRRSEIDNLSDEEIASLLFMIKRISETEKPDGYDKTNTRAFINKNGIRVILQKNWKEDNRNWIVTGYGIIDSESKELNLEATETIKTVNALYGYKPEHSRLREQVGAVIASISTIRQQQENVKELKSRTKIEKGIKTISTSNPKTVYDRAILKSSPKNCSDKELISSFAAIEYAINALENKNNSSLFKHTKAKKIIEKAADRTLLNKVNKELLDRGYTYEIHNSTNETSINYQRVVVMDVSSGKEHLANLNVDNPAVKYENSPDKNKEQEFNSVNDDIKSRVEEAHKIENTVMIKNKEWGDVLVCRYNEKKDGFEYCLFNQAGEISRVQNNPGFYEMSYLKEYYLNKTEILPIDAANTILINNQDGDKNWKRTDSDSTYDQQWLIEPVTELSLDEKDLFMETFDIVIKPLDYLVNRIKSEGFSLNETETDDLKHTIDYWFETWNYELAYDEGELCFLDHDSEYAETLDFDEIKRLLHNMLVSVNDTKDSELDWQKNLLQKFEPDPELEKLKEKYLKAFEKGMDSSRQAAFDELPADATKEAVNDKANEIFGTTANPDEVVGYYLSFYPDKYLEIWNENIKNHNLTEEDKTVTVLLQNLYEKEHIHMHSKNNIEQMNLREYVNTHLPSGIGPLSSYFIDKLELYTKGLSDDILLYDKVNDKAYRVINGNRTEYEKTKNSRYLEETNVKELFKFAADEAYNYQSTADEKTQSAEIAEAKSAEKSFNFYLNEITASRFADLVQCYGTVGDDKIRNDSVHKYAFKLNKENTDILSLSSDDETGYELGVETNVEGHVCLMYLNKVNKKTGVTLYESLETHFDDSQKEIWNHAKKFVEAYIHDSFPEDYEIVADYAFPETYKYINSDGNTIELTTYEEPRWNFRDEKILLKAVQESDPDFYKKLMEIISEYPDEHFSFDLGKELSYDSFVVEKSWNKNHDFSLESLDEKLNNVFRFRYWNNYDENEIEINNFNEYGEEIVIKDEQLVKKLNALIESHVRYNITKYQTFKKYREERIPLLIRENFKSIVGEGPLHETDNELYLEGSFLSSELSSLIGLGTDEKNNWSDVNGNKYIRKYNIYKLYDLKGGDKINTIPFKFDGDPDRLFIEYYDKNDKVSSTQKLSEDVLPFGTVELVNKCFDEQAAREMHQPLITEKNIINLAKSEISHFDKDFDLPNSHGKRVGRIWTYTLPDDFEKVLGIQGKTYVKDGEEKILYFNLYQDFEYDDNGKIDLSKPSDLLLYEYYNDGIDEINCGVEKISDVLQNNSEYLQRFVSEDVAEIKDNIIQTITNSFKNYIRDELDTNEIKLDVEMENNKQRGWLWIHYNDASGSLHSPSGESYFSYDWSTKEYKVKDDSRWEMFEGAPDEDTSFSAFKKEAEEYIRKNITNGDFELTHKYIDRELTKNLFVQAVGTDISDRLWDEIESRQNERDFNLVCDYEVDSQGTIISFDFKKQDIDNEYNETPTTALDIINEVIAWDDKEVSELHAGTADDEDIQKINQYIKDLEQLRDEIDIDVDVFENCRIDVHNNVEDAYIHITLNNGNIVHIPMEYVSDNELDDFWYGFRYKGKDFDLNITGESFTGEKDVYQCAVYAVDENGHVDTADYSSAEAVIMDAYHKYVPEMNYKVASDEQILQAFNKAGFELSSPSMLNLFNEELSEFWAEEIVLGPDGKLYWHDIEGEQGYEFAVLDKSRISSIFDDVEEALESHLTDEEYYDEEEMQEAKNFLTELKNISGQYMLVKEVHAFTDDIDKMRDFDKLSKEEFLSSYSYLNEEEYDATAAELKEKGLTGKQMVEKLEGEFDLEPVLQEVFDANIETLDPIIDEAKLYHPEDYGLPSDDFTHVVVEFHNNEELVGKNFTPAEIDELMNNAHVNFKGREVRFNAVDAEEGGIKKFFENLKEHNKELSFASKLGLTQLSDSQHRPYSYLASTSQDGGYVYFKFNLDKDSPILELSDELKELKSENWREITVTFGSEDAFEPDEDVSEPIGIYISGPVSKTQIVFDYDNENKPVFPLGKEIVDSCKEAVNHYMNIHFPGKTIKEKFFTREPQSIDIIDEEVKLDSVQLAGEKFIGELNKNIGYHKNNPWITSKIILDEMKEKNPEEHKLLQKYFIEKNIKTREDYIKFFEENLGVVKSSPQIQKKTSFNPGENKTVKREKDTEPDFGR